MAIQKTTQIANRYGLDIKFYDITDTAKAQPVLTVDFANVSDIAITGDRTWATGGQTHSNQIGFNDPMTGTMTISTQIMTSELLTLVSGGNAAAIKAAANSVTFKNDKAGSVPGYFIIVAETVWQDKDGVIYNETLTCHKACAKRAYNISYSGEGDPTSIDIEFDLMENADGEVLTVEKADVA